MNFTLEQSPYIRRKDSLNTMMGDVLIALSPVVVFALIVYQQYALRNILVSVFTMVFVDFAVLFFKNLILRKKKQNQSLFAGIRLSAFLVPCVSGVIFALITPATFWALSANGTVDYTTLSSTNPWTDSYAYLVLFVGALFGSVVGKHIFSFFGGTGKNILNPAATGFVFSKFVFGSRYAVAKYSASVFSWDIATGATTLAGNGGGTGMFDASAYTWGNLGKLLIGDTAGLMGETCKIAILIGLAYLLIRHTIDWRVVASFFGTLVVGLLLTGFLVQIYSPGVNPFLFMLIQLCAGGVLFGGVYMITDPATSPVTEPSRVLFGMLIAICTLFFRYTGYEEFTHEGMAFSILIGNAIVPLLDYNKWNSNEFNRGNVIFLACFPIVMLLILSLSVSGALGLFQGKRWAANTSTGGSTPWEGLFFPLGEGPHIGF